MLDITKPSADAGADQAVLEGTAVTLHGEASTDNVGITSYTWTFTDLTPKTLTSVNPSYTFNNIGNVQVTLNVSDSVGNWDTDTVSIIVSADTISPTANAGQDQTANVGVTVTFDAGESTDNVGIVSYEWNFGDGTSGTGKTATHAYSNLGTYTATLTVKDSAGNTDTDTTTITVRSAETPSIPTETLLMWLIGAAIAIAGISAVIIFLLKRRK